MRGRKPKPTQQQIAEGDPRKHGKNKLREALKAEPKATTGLPSCPRYLKGRARSSWNFWSEELKAMSLDKRPDAPMLEGACRAYERAVQADLIIDKEGLIIQDKGYVVRKEGEGEKAVEHKTMTVHTRKHPAVEISARCWLIVRAFCSEFGLSPVSRMRLRTEDAGKGSQQDDLMALLSQPREPRAPAVN